MRERSGQDVANSRHAHLRQDRRFFVGEGRTAAASLPQRPAPGNRIGTTAPPVGPCARVAPASPANPIPGTPARIIASPSSQNPDASSRRTACVFA